MSRAGFATLPAELLQFYFPNGGNFENNTLVSRYRGVQLHSDKFYFISSPIGETALSLSSHPESFTFPFTAQVNTTEIEPEPSQTQD